MTSATIVPSASEMFQCRDYPLPIALKCDGIVQCIPDGIDEADCPNTTAATTTPSPLKIGKQS